LMCVKGAEMAQEDDEERGVRYVRYRGKKRMGGGRLWFAMRRVYAKYTLSPDAFINAFFALCIVSFLTKDSKPPSIPSCPDASRTQPFPESSVVDARVAGA